MCLRDGTATDSIGRATGYIYGVPTTQLHHMHVSEEDKNEKAAGYTMYVSACTSEPATDTMAPFVLGFHRAKQQVAENKVRLRDELLGLW